ncbi:TolC family protein [Paraburkholderia sp. J12]|uniref:TolC family protein n=1 Tax=Paraburkholderia sp. J12 TaxID=2805432 RepID=UPI002ABDDC53|nr:TolC family protein [Paraburkholderia sp. J12]
MRLSVMHYGGRFKATPRILSIIAAFVFAHPGLASGVSLNDPLSALGSIPSSPAKDLVAAPDPCDLATPLQPMLALSDAVEHALCHNPQTREAWANVKLQAATIGEKQAAYLPTLTVSGSYGPVEKSTSYPGLPEFDSTLSTRSSDVNGSLNWVLYDFGLRSANLEQARQLLNAASANQDAVLQAVFFTTAQHYYAVQAAQGLTVSTLDAEHYGQQSFDVANEKYKLGVGTLADKLAAQTALDQATLKRVQAEGDLKTAIGNLAIDMGIPPETPVTVSSAFGGKDDPSFMNAAVNQLIDEAVAAHPKVLSAEAQVKAAQAQIDAIKAQGRPTISLFATDDRSNTPIQEVSSEEIVGTRTIGIQISIPLFEGFSREYKIHEARAELEEKEAELSNIEQQVALETWTSFNDLKTQMSSLNATASLSKSARESYDVAYGRYKAGVGSLLELLNAQSNLASADQQRVLALTRYRTACLRLGASLGQLRLDTVRDKSN